MARARSTPRTVCVDCGEDLTSMDQGRQTCLLCRAAREKGRGALGRRYAFVTKRRRALGLEPSVPADPFEGLDRGE